jgi:hypothetical protein
MRKGAVEDKTVRSRSELSALVQVSHDQWSQLVTHPPPNDSSPCSHRAKYWFLPVHRKCRTSLCSPTLNRKLRSV